MKSSGMCERDRRIRAATADVIAAAREAVRVPGTGCLSDAAKTERLRAALAAYDAAAGKEST